MINVPIKQQKEGDNRQYIYGHLMDFQKYINDSFKQIWYVFFLWNVYPK